MICAAVATPAFRRLRERCPYGWRPLRGAATGEVHDSFLVVCAEAIRSSANLDRLQIIKGWLDAADGQSSKRLIYDLAVLRRSATSAATAAARLARSATPWILRRATWTNTIGDFRARRGMDRTPISIRRQRAVLLRTCMLEIPTPRWTAYEAARYGVALPQGAPTKTQERAYTSPIWYTPKN